METVRVQWNDAAIEALLNDPAGPVGRVIGELSEQVATVARSVVHVRNPATRSRRRRAGLHSSAWPPGYTKESIRVHGPVVGSRGGMYGGVNAVANPGLFLEHPAIQMNFRYPFLTTGLDALGTP